MIERTIKLVVEGVPPSSGNDLVGFSIDVDHFFSADELFDDVQVKQTDQPSELLRVRVKLVSRAIRMHEISASLCAIWSRLGYPHFEASSVTRYREAVVMRFVTVMSGERLAVTGTAIVSGPTYADAVREFEHGFSKLPPYPGGLPQWATEQ